MSKIVKPAAALCLAVMLLAGCASRTGSSSTSSSSDNTNYLALALLGVAGYGQGYANAYRAAPAYQPTIHCSSYTSYSWSCY